jgi:2'-5' RNA ligase
MARLFVAVWPPPEVVATLSALDRPALAGVRWSAPDHPQPFRADVVLARGRVPKELAGRPVSGSWTARSVALVADRSSPLAARYEDLAVVPLGE